MTKKELEKKIERIKIRTERKYIAKWDLVRRFIDFLISIDHYYHKYDNK